MDDEIQRIFKIHNQVYDTMMVLIAEKDKQIEQQNVIIQNLLLLLEKKKHNKELEGKNAE